MSSYMIEQLQVQENEKEILSYISRLQTERSKCDIALKRYYDLQDKLKEFGCVTKECSPFSVDELKRKIDLAINEMKKISRPNEQDVEMCSEKYHSTCSVVDATISEALKSQKKKLNDVMNEAVAGAHKLNFEVKSNVKSVAVKKAAKSFRLDAELEQEAQSLIIDCTLPQSFRDNLKSEMEFAKQQTDQQLLNVVSQRIDKIVCLAQEYEKAVTNYKAQCYAAHIPLKDLPCNKEGIDQILKETDTLKKRQQHETEQTYIRQSLNKAMKDLGYNIYTADHNEKVETTLYEVSDDVFIETCRQGDQVTISFSKGKGADSSLVKDTMTEWCSKNHNALLEKLEEFGIEMRVKNAYPPEMKYVKNIAIADAKHDEVVEQIEESSYYDEEIETEEQEQLTMQAEYPDE